ncbi:geranylgeranyl diphosphate synthase [Pontimonas salivibrio]|uniref:Geranylgeranyl diphosphate synthase n=1 Tax=Pontimonas salivibrio TaxID=1159327 RepID=A0A2L2BQL0_9MICO|nr:polyprenyl synthetase family protein [Pontimonas salivibrio]AVG23938.1 geranylgeranyl diphosphate synthase [Pontimonas salivibrio]
MSNSLRFVDIIDSQLQRFFDQKADEVAEISADLAPLIDYSRSLLRGGKRFRARFCFWGWRSIAGLTNQPHPQTGDHPAFELATALEMFHAAALVHDDIMDRSDTRRGELSAHRHFEEHHKGSGFGLDAGHYGESTALLVGDLMLAWSSELVTQALSGVTVPSVIAGTRREFHRMWNEVTLGQYLDIHEESAWPTVSDDERFHRAMRVVTFKSAKYSMEAPLLLGASMADASDNQLRQLAHFGLPLGVAFQLRDDLLGVFGDPEETGKPAGDDLREGKRTVLIALAEAQMSPGVKGVFNDMLGNPEVTDEQIAIMQHTLRDTGAVDRVETIITESSQRALSALETDLLDGEAVAELRNLADAVVSRSA